MTPSSVRGNNLHASSSTNEKQITTIDCGFCQQSGQKSKNCLTHHYTYKIMLLGSFLKLSFETKSPFYWPSKQNTVKKKKNSAHILWTEEFFSCGCSVE